MLKAEIVGSLQHGKGKVLKVRMFYSNQPACIIQERSLMTGIQAWRKARIWGIWSCKNCMESNQQKAVSTAIWHGKLRFRCTDFDSFDLRYAIKMIDKTHEEFDLPSLEKEIMILKKVY